MSRLRILVAGTLAGAVGQGGAAWAVLQYVLGLTRLGHQVHLVEPVDEPTSQVCRYFKSICERFDIKGQIVDGSSTFAGFDLVLNFSGLLPARSIAAIPSRAYIDLDPAFNQLWHDEGIDRGFDGHTHFVTVGQAIGREGCRVPTLGLSWIASLPPVVLAEWPPDSQVSTDALTTIGNFRAYGSIERDGLTYGQKAHSLRRLRRLPRKAGQRLVLAMTVHEGDGADLAALRDGGWEFVDPLAVAGTPDAYRAFIQGSRAEIGVAKSGYVTSRCGWFSDRSACYLASGRPVVAEDTGFTSFLPSGTGLMAFHNEDEAVLAIDSVRSDYARHSRAARDIAMEFLDSDKVLTRLLATVAA